MSEVEVIAKRLMNIREDLHAGYPVKKPSGDRETQIIGHQLVTGHTPILATYLHRIGKLPTARCQKCDNSDCGSAACNMCGATKQSAEHVLLHCPASERLRLRLGIEQLDDFADQRKLEEVVRCLIGWPSRPPELPGR